MSLEGANLEKSADHIFNDHCIAYLNEKLKQAGVDAIFLKDTIGSFYSLYKPIMRLEGEIAETKLDKQYEQLKPYFDTLVKTLQADEKITKLLEKHKLVFTSHQISQHFLDKTPYGLDKVVYAMLHTCCVPKGDDTLKYLKVNDKLDYSVKLTKNKCTIIDNETGMVEIFVYMDDFDPYDIGIEKGVVDQIITGMGLDPADFHSNQKEAVVEVLRMRVEKVKLHTQDIDDKDKVDVVAALNITVNKGPNSGYIPYYDEASKITSSSDLRRSLSLIPQQQEKKSDKESENCVVM